MTPCSSLTAGTRSNSLILSRQHLAATRVADEIRAGASLRAQLRLAVERCDACIFVATRRSLESSWCGAELGAFWGAGKPIVVYLADPSLPEGDLPPIVQGDVWERRISRLVVRAEEIISEANDARSDVTSVVAGPAADYLGLSFDEMVSILKQRTLDDIVEIAQPQKSVSWIEARLSDLGVRKPWHSGHLLEIFVETEMGSRSDARAANEVLRAFGLVSLAGYYFLSDSGKRFWLRVSLVGDQEHRLRAFWQTGRDESDE